MKQYKVTGMSCAACQARVEKAVGGVPGVTSCAVSLLTNSMGVEGTADPKDIIKAVKDAGYGASLKKSENDSAGSEAELEDDLELEEDMIKYIISSVLEEAPEEMAFLNSFVDKGLLDRLHNILDNEFVLPAKNMVHMHNRRYPLLYTVCTRLPVPLHLHNPKRLACCYSTD
mgnify:CR=1 FL=1